MDEHLVRKGRGIAALPRPIAWPVCPRVLRSAGDSCEVAAQEEGPVGSAKQTASILLNSFKVFDLVRHLPKRNLMVINFHRLYMSRLNTEFDEGVFAHSLRCFLSRSSG